MLKWPSDPRCSLPRPLPRLLNPEPGPRKTRRRPGTDRAARAPRAHRAGGGEQAPVVDKPFDSTPRGLDLHRGRTKRPSVGQEEGAAEKRPETSDSQSKPVEDRIARPAARPAAASRKTESKPSKKGGASSRAAKGSASSSGRISASTGSAISAALVRARVAGRKPPGSGRGTVIVSFGDLRSGDLSPVTRA